MNNLLGTAGVGKILKKRNCIQILFWNLSKLFWTENKIGTELIDVMKLAPFAIGMALLINSTSIHQMIHQPLAALWFHFFFCVFHICRVVVSWCRRSADPLTASDYGSSPLLGRVCFSGGNKNMEHYWELKKLIFSKCLDRVSMNRFYTLVEYGQIFVEKSG